MQARSDRIDITSLERFINALDDDNDGRITLANILVMFYSSRTPSFSAASSSARAKWTHCCCLFFSSA
jgi:hypothetical protein